MIISKSFISEILRMTIAVTFVVIAIFFVLRGMGFLSHAAKGLIPINGVSILVLFKIVSYLDMLIPLMFYIAAIMVINRWYAENQMAVLASAGMGLTYFLKPLGFIVFVLTSIIVVFSFYLTPLANEKSFVFEAKLRNSNEVSGVITGKFVEGKGGNVIYFVEKYNRSSDFYENVFAYSSTTEREEVGVAKKAYRTEDALTEDQFLVLLNGSRYEGSPGSPDYRVIDFEKYALRLEPKRVGKIALQARAKPNKELIGSTDLELRSEWYWRIAKVFVLPILALFALALSHVDSRRGKANGLVLAFFVYITYYYLLGYTVALVKKGDVTSGLAIWSVHVSYFVFALYCLYRRNLNYPLMPQFIYGKRSRG